MLSDTAKSLHQSTLFQWYTKTIKQFDLESLRALCVFRKSDGRGTVELFSEALFQPA